MENLMTKSSLFRSKRGSAFVLGVCLAPWAFPGCELDEGEEVHLGIHLGNCNDTLFRTICLAKEVSDDGRPIAHLPETFRMTLTGKVKVRGRDTTVADLPIAADFGTESDTRIDLPDSLSKSDPPLALRACVKDRSDSLLCAVLYYDGM